MRSRVQPPSTFSRPMRPGPVTMRGQSPPPALLTPHETEVASIGSSGAASDLSRLSDRHVNSIARPALGRTRTPKPLPSGGADASASRVDGAMEQ